MRPDIEHPPTGTRPQTTEVMRAELQEALLEALRELRLLPSSPDGAVVGLYAVMDDLRRAMRRTEEIDLRRSA